MPEHFSIRDLSVSLSGTPILEHITYSVKEPGHMIALLGPNGSGFFALFAGRSPMTARSV